MRTLRQAIALEPNLIGPLGRFLSVEYDKCFNCADYFSSAKHNSTNIENKYDLQVDEIPFVAAFNEVLVLPDGGIVTDTGTVIYEDILAAPLMHVANAVRVICTDSIRKAIAYSGNPIRRLLLHMPRMERHIAGRALLFGGNSNFSHLLNDFLSKVAAYRQRESVDYVILSNDCHAAAAEFLVKLGFPAGTLIRQRENEVLRVDHLVVPSLAHRFPDLPVEHVKWLRTQFSARCSAGSSRRRLAISRRGALGRNVENTAELECVFADYGIEEVGFAGRPVDEQLEILASAELIIGAAGGGSAGFFFVPTDCLIVELRFPYFQAFAEQYGKVLTAIGYRYHLLECAWTPLQSLTGADGNLHVPVDRLRSVLTEWLGARSGAEVDRS